MGKKKDEKVETNRNEQPLLMTQRVTIEVPEKQDFRLAGAPDTHFPFVKESRIKDFLYHVKDKKPTHVAQLGDLFDQYSFSRYIKAVDFISAEKELLEARKMAKDFWSKICKIVPNAIKFQLWGNHDQRIVTYVYEKASKFSSFVKNAIQDLYKFPGVTTVGPYGSEVKIRLRLPNDLEYQDIFLLHGVYTGPTSHIRRFGDSVMRAHSHKASVNIQTLCSGKTIFELDCGCIVDKDQLVFKYAQTFDPGWTPGFGYVEKTDGHILQTQFIRFP